MAFFPGLQSFLGQQIGNISSRLSLGGERTKARLQQIRDISSRMLRAQVVPQPQQPVLTGEAMPGAIEKVLGRETPGFEQRTTIQQPPTRQPTPEEIIQEQLRIFGNIQKPEDVIVPPDPREEQLRIFGGVQKPEDVIAPSQPTAPPVQTPESQRETAAAAQPAYLQRQTEAETIRNQLSAAFQQAQVIQNKLTLIGQAQERGYTGNSFEGAQDFLGGKRDEDEEFIETEDTSDTLRQQIEAIDAMIRGEFGTIAGLTGESPEVRAKRQEIENIVQSGELGIETARQRPIATPFIRGQAAAIQRQTELSTRPLIAQLADFQRGQETRADLARLRLQELQGRRATFEDAATRAERREKEKREEAQTRQSEINQIVLQAAQGGADQATLQRIGQAKTTAKAIEAAGESLRKQAREIELDTFTDAQGNRITTLYNPDTGTTRQLNLGKTKAEGAGGTLTLAEAKSLGLPSTLAGKSEAQVMADLQSSQVSSWFTDWINLMERTGRQISPQEAEARWEDFRREILLSRRTTGGGTSEGGISGEEEPFK